MTFRQASNCCKKILEAAIFAYVKKTKEPITSLKFVSHYFWQILNSILCKSKSAIPPQFNSLEVLSSWSDKTKLIAKNFSKNSNLNNSNLNLKLHNIYVTSWLVKKVITDLDLSKAFGRDCIFVMVLKNCAPELSYILAELFSVCL